jgi:hypothetical protein
VQGCPAVAVLSIGIGTSVEEQFDCGFVSAPGRTVQGCPAVVVLSCLSRSHHGEHSTSPTRSFRLPSSQTISCMKKCFSLGIGTSVDEQFHCGFVPVPAAQCRAVRPPRSLFCMSVPQSNNVTASEQLLPAADAKRIHQSRNTGRCR